MSYTNFLIISCVKICLFNINEYKLLGLEVQLQRFYFGIHHIQLQIKKKCIYQTITSNWHCMVIKYTFSFSDTYL